MATLSGTVRMERVGESNNIALFILERPEKSNAYHDAMIGQFSELLRGAVADPSIRAGIVTGAGNKVFCAGADISQFVGKTYEDALNLQSRALFYNWANAPWPTIAAIQGAAIAGGLELALASDCRICTQTSWFSLPEIDLGLIPAAGGIRRLTKLLNEARAKSMILFGQKVDSATALEWGLVSQISEQVLDDAIRLAEVATRRDALATRLAKVALQSNNTSLEDANLEAVMQAFLYHRKIQTI